MHSHLKMLSWPSGLAYRTQVLVLAAECVPVCAVMAAIELYTPQGAEMVSGMIYELCEPCEPDEQG